MPVLGPTLWTSTTTRGTSIMWANPMPSCFREKPGPDVLVMDFRPARLAPMAMWIEAISSSAWTKAISYSRSARTCMISEAGVIG